MRIFHIASRADWDEARRTGTYSTSTLGRTLEEEGFIHAARREQVPGVFARHYADAGVPLVLVTLDTSRIRSEVRLEAVGDELYPHVYGPIPTSAAVDVKPLDRRGRPVALSTLFVREMLLRMALGVGCMALAFAGAAVGRSFAWAYAEVVGAVALLLVGLAASRAFLRRRG